LIIWQQATSNPPPLKLWRAKPATNNKQPATRLR